MSNQERDPSARSGEFETYFRSPRAYTLVYEWGQFAVSKAADSDYGIAPLAEGVLRGDAVLPELPKKAVELILLSPEELNASNRVEQLSISEDATSRAIIGSQLTEDKTLQIAMGFDRSAEQMLEAELVKHATLAGAPVDEFREHYSVEKGGVPVVEYFGNEIPQALLHGLTTPELAKLIAIWAPAQESKKHRRFMMRRMPGRSVMKAMGIVMDIHESFCRAHFERVFEESLDIRKG